MPFRNFHACRMRSPEDFKPGSLRTVVRADLNLIVGRLKADPSKIATQAIRYPTAKYTAAEARRECRATGGKSFEAARVDAATDPRDRIPVLVPRAAKLLSVSVLSALEDGDAVVHAEEAPWDFAFVDKTKGGRFAVMRKESPEYMNEPIVLEVFDDEDEANEYRDKQNARLVQPAMYAEGDEDEEDAEDEDEEDANALADGKTFRTATIKDKEIIAAGTWRAMDGTKVTLTKDDLRAIVANFIALKDKVKPYLKPGHMKDADVTKMSGMPAWGWIDNPRVVGDKIVADFKKVPIAVKKLMGAGAYARVSAEIAARWEDTDSGKSYGPVLRAVGVLGATAPAVNTLKDLVKLYTAHPEQLVALGDDDDNAGLLCLVEYLTEGDDVMKVTKTTDQMTLEEKVAHLMAQSQAQTDRDTKLAEALGIEPGADPVAAVLAMRKDSEAATKAAQEAATAKFATDRDALILAAKKAGRVLPSQEPGIVAMVDGWKLAAAANKDGVLKLAFGEKDVEGDVLTCLAAYLETLQPVVSFGELMPAARKADGSRLSVSADIVRFSEEAGRIGQNIVIDAGSAAMDAQVTAYMKEHGVTYDKALCALAEIEMPTLTNESLADANLSRS